MTITIDHQLILYLVLLVPYSYVGLGLLWMTMFSVMGSGMAFKEAVCLFVVAVLWAAGLYFGTKLYY